MEPLLTAHFSEKSPFLDRSSPLMNVVKNTAQYGFKREIPTIVN